MAKYLDNKEFFKEIVLSKEADKLTDTACTMIIKICTESSKKFKYKYEEDREDCLQFGIEACLKYWRSFNPEKSNNAFAYFTQIFKHGSANGFNNLYPIKSKNKISISRDHGIYNI